MKNIVFTVLGAILCVQCNSDYVINEEMLLLEKYTGNLDSYAIIEENDRRWKDAREIEFTDSDFLITTQPMSDNTIAPLDYDTNLVGNHAYDIKVYLSAFSRVKNVLSVDNDTLSVNVKSGIELNMSEDLFSYIVNVITLWNKWIKNGDFSIIKSGEGYSIEPSANSFKAMRSGSPVNLANCPTFFDEYLTVKNVVENAPIGTYIGEHICLYFRNTSKSNICTVRGNKFKLFYYVCNGCAEFNEEENCNHNYIATSVDIPCTRGYGRSLRNIHHLSLASFREESAS